MPTKESHRILVTEIHPFAPADVGRAVARSVWSETEFSGTRTELVGNGHFELVARHLFHQITPNMPP
jgi:hypothetical protein